MMTTPVTGRAARLLPRLVDQLRILLWFQMYLTLIGVLAVTLDLGIFGSALTASYDNSWADSLFATMLALILVAILLAISAKLTRRGWMWVYALIVLTELAVVAVIMFAARIGVGAVLFGVLYGGLTGWVIADLCRGEVRRHFFSRFVRQPI
jgi:hypothetical protein